MTNDHRKIMDICADLVKRQDYGRYVMVLFAPRHLRRFLWGLYALNCELVHIRHAVAKERMMGLIRLQWWRDAIAALYRGQVLNHHVLQNLAPLIQDASFWTADDFDRLINSFEDDFCRDDETDFLSSRIRQNAVLLDMALRVYSIDKTGYIHDVELLSLATESWTRIKALMQGEWAPPNPQAVITETEQQLRLIPRQKIRGFAPLLCVDITRYDCIFWRRHHGRIAEIPTEIYRTSMAFYVWRRNLFFNSSVF